MRIKNLSLFEGLYDLILKVDNEDPEYAMCIAGSIIASYNWDKVRYAVENDWDLHDLDRWEAASRFFRENPKEFKEILGSNGVIYSRDFLAGIMLSGDQFIKMVVDPLYERDVEIMELLPKPRRTCLKGGCALCQEEK